MSKGKTKHYRNSQQVSSMKRKKNSHKKDLDSLHALSPNIQKINSGHKNDNYIIVTERENEADEEEKILNDLNDELNQQELREIEDDFQNLP